MQSRIKYYLRRLILLNDSPERIALAFALGVFLAFSPLIGLHTLLALTFSFFFGLNRIALLLGVFVNNPWTLIPIYGAGTWLGGLFVGFPSRVSLPSLELSSMLSSRFWQELAGQWPIIKPMVLGSFILSLPAAVVSYFAVVCVIRRIRAQDVART